MEYRGINLHEGVKLFNKNQKRYGIYNDTVKNGIDRFISQLEENKYVLLSEFKKNGIKVKIKCDKNHEFDMVPNAVVSKQKCPICQNRSLEHVKESFRNSVESNGHILLDYISKSKNKGVLIDFKCGHKPRWLRGSDYENGTRCAKCSNHCPEQAKENFLKLLEEEGYERIGEYIDSITRVKTKCPNGHIFNAQPNGFVHNDERCRKCRYIQNSIDRSGKDEFLLLVEKKGHKLLSEYINANTNVLIDFRCGHKPDWVKPSLYNKNRECLVCSGFATSEKAKADFEKKLKKNKHKLLSEYKDSCKTKVLIDFKCGHDPHWILPKLYKRGCTCPLCKDSKGEKIIREWLDKSHVHHTKGRISKRRRWLYDIIIPSENLIVEVQGSQHFKEVVFFDRRTLEEEQENDRQKREYAESLGYQYMEVDYREHIPELALERFLDQFPRIRKGSAPINLKYEQLSLF